jgi:hypothetical protein
MPFAMLAVAVVACSGDVGGELGGSGGGDVFRRRQLHEVSVLAFIKRLGV